MAVEDLSAGFRSLTDEAGGAGELSVDDQAASLDLPVAELERLGFAQAHEAVWGRDEDQTELIVRVLRFEGDEGPRSVDDAVSQPDAIVVADPVEGLPGSEVLTPDEGEPPFVYVTVSCGSYFVYVYELGPAASATEVQDVLLGQVEALSSPGP